MFEDLKKLKTCYSFVIKVEHEQKSVSTAVTLRRMFPNI